MVSKRLSNVSLRDSPILLSQSHETNPYTLPDDILQEICNHIVSSAAEDALNVMCSASYFFRYYHDLLLG